MYPVFNFPKIYKVCALQDLPSKTVYVDTRFSTDTDAIDIPLDTFSSNVCRKYRDLPDSEPLPRGTVTEGEDLGREIMLLQLSSLETEGEMHGVLKKLPCSIVFLKLKCSQYPSIHTNDIISHCTTL